VLSLFLSSISYSQYDLNAGMGLNFFSAPDLRDYVNSNFSSTEEMASFNTSADFFIGFAYNLNESYQIGLEYNYNIYSFNSNSILGIYDLQINKHEPSLVGYYQIIGNGYKFKLGGGFGYRLGYADEKQPGTTEIIDYSSTGFGLLAKAQGDTKLGGNFYALIAGEIRYDLHSDIETITPNVSFNLNSFGVALKLGVVHYF
jgi:hypothetical protein